jgi:hypothetical protein
MRILGSVDLYNNYAGISGMALVVHALEAEKLVSLNVHSNGFECYLHMKFLSRITQKAFFGS